MHFKIHYKKRSYKRQCILNLIHEKVWRLSIAFTAPNLTVTVLKLNIRKGNDPILKNSQKIALLSEIYTSSSLRRTCLSWPTMSLKSVLGGTTMETFSPLYTRTLVPASLSWAVSTVWYENESENQRLYVTENFHLYVGQYLNTIKHVLFSQPLS